MNVCDQEQNDSDDLNTAIIQKTLYTVRHKKPLQNRYYFNNIQTMSMKFMKFIAK